MDKEDKKIQKHLIDEMMKVSETNPDVIIYMQTLMENYERQEQKIFELQHELLNKKLNAKDIEYKEKIIYKGRIDKAIEYIEYVKKLNQKNKNNMEWEYDVLFPELENILQGSD